MLERSTYYKIPTSSNGTTVNGYQGSESDSEVKGEGNSYTTHFRQLDPRIGRWLSIDPKRTAWESPYVSMGDNPILYNDVLGDSVLNKFQGKLANQALKLFMKSNFGKEFIGRYAAKGQTIWGHTYSEDGVYHKKGIDLFFTDKKNVDKYGDATDQGTTEYKIVDERLKISINLNSAFKNNHPDITALKESNDSRNYDLNKEKHLEIWRKVVGQKVMVFTHELLIHGYIHTVDTLDGKMDNNVGGGKGGFKHHDYFGNAISRKSINSNDVANLFFTEGWKIYTGAHSYLKTGLSLEEMQRNFTHGLTNIGIHD